MNSNMNMGSAADKGLPVLASCREVVLRGAMVFFHPEKIAPAIRRWGSLLDAGPAWDHPCHFFDGTMETVRWIFTLDVLNHCFWPDPEERVWTVRYQNEDWSGYWGLAASLKRAREAGFAITDPVLLSKISAKDIEAIFSYSFTPERLASEPGTASPSTSTVDETTRSVKPGRIPMFSERLRNLREAGTVILTELGGDLASLLDRAAGSAVRLVGTVTDLFPSFRDKAEYGGGEVFFWKRAQIFAADVFAAFEGKGPGNFQDIGELTAFADYKLPQVLRELGIISYHPALAEKVDGLVHLEPGSAPEVEIRAMTVVAVDEVRKAFEGNHGAAAGSVPRPGIGSARVDSWLWRLGQMDEFRKRPYHRCRTIYY